MDETTRQRVIEALEHAIKAEHDGHHFYLMAATSTQDEKGQQVLRRLAEEELDHQRYLQGQRLSLIEHGEVDLTLTLGPKASLDGTHPIFSANIQARAGQAHMEMSALSIGIQLELGSTQFYQEQAKAAPHEALRDLFEGLAEWESGHYHALLQQYDALKGDYWAANGFAPF